MWKNVFMLRKSGICLKGVWERVKREKLRNPRQRIYCGGGKNSFGILKKSLW